MITAGALITANVRIGGLIMSFAMLMVILIRDNPWLGVNEHTQKVNFLSMLKDLAVVGMGVLYFMRRLTVKHRRGD
jgi:hypothetical protein